MYEYAISENLVWKFNPGSRANPRPSCIATTTFMPGNIVTNIGYTDGSLSKETASFLIAVDPDGRNRVRSIYPIDPADLIQ